MWIHLLLCVMPIAGRSVVGVPGSSMPRCLRYVLQVRGAISVAFASIARKPARATDTVSNWTAACWPELRSAVSNGQWPQARLFSAMPDIALTNKCQRCHASVGTIMHRHACPAVPVEWRIAPPPPDVAAFIAGLLPDARHLAITRALVSSNLLNVPPPAHGCSLVWVVHPNSGVIPAGAVVYTDGSLLDGPSSTIARVGFGFWALGPDGRCVAAAYDTPPCWVRTIHGAELWGLYAAASVFMLGVAYWLDCYSVVETFQRGAVHAVSSERVLARPWSMLCGVRRVRVS